MCQNAGDRVQHGHGIVRKSSGEAPSLHRESYMHRVINSATEFRIFHVLALVGCLAGSVVDTSAHEFWIEPDASQIEIGASFSATLNVGQDLAGSTYSYLPQRFERFTVTSGGSTKPVESRVGDNPALQMSVDQPGLQIIAYQSEIEGLTYTSPEKFEQFLDYEGLDWVLEEHKRRGLPAENFRESYSRFAKSLVQVGPYNPDTSSEDRAVGLPIELVALNSPFEPGREQIDVQLLRSGLPLDNIQIATFQRNSDGSVSRRLTRSNADGMAEIEISGDGFILISAVQMEAIKPDQEPVAVNGRVPVWQSLWASLSFQLN